MNRGSMHKNLFLVVLLLVVSALVARHFLGSSSREGARLGSDLKQCVDLLWGTTQSHIEVEGPSTALLVKASVFLPPQAGASMATWNHPFLSFVASRHPAVQVASWQLVNMADGQTIPTPDQLLQEKARPGGSFADAEHFESARSEVLRMNGQLQLDQELGAGAALLLVQVTSTPVAGPTQSSESVAPQRVAEAAPSLAPGRSRRPTTLPDENRLEPSPEPFQAAQIEAVLVLKQAESRGRAEELARTGLQTAGGGLEPSLRVLVLP